MPTAPKKCVSISENSQPRMRQHSAVGYFRVHWSAEGYRPPPMECERIAPATRHRRWLVWRVADDSAPCVRFVGVGDSLMREHTDEVCAVVSAKAERQADSERQSGTEHGVRHTPTHRQRR